MGSGCSSEVNKNVVDGDEIMQTGVDSANAAANALASPMPGQVAPQTFPPAEPINHDRPPVIHENAPASPPCAPGAFAANALAAGAPITSAVAGQMRMSGSQMGGHIRMSGSQMGGHIEQMGEHIESAQMGGHLDATASQMGGIIEENEMIANHHDESQIYGADHQMPAEFFQPRECVGGNCPQPTHEEIAPGVFRDLKTQEILYSQGAEPQGQVMQAVEAATGVEAQRLSHASQLPPDTNVIRLSQGDHHNMRASQLSHQGGNNIIVAAALTQPPAEEQPQAAEPAPAEAEEAPQQEEAQPAPRKEKKRRWRKKKSRRGRDESKLR